MPSSLSSSSHLIKEDFPATYHSLESAKQSAKVLDLTKSSIFDVYYDRQKTINTLERLDQRRSKVLYGGELYNESAIQGKMMNVFSQQREMLTSKLDRSTIEFIERVTIWSIPVGAVLAVNLLPRIPIFSLFSLGLLGLLFSSVIAANRNSVRSASDFPIEHQSDELLAAVKKAEEALQTAVKAKDLGKTALSA